MKKKIISRRNLIQGSIIVSIIGLMMASFFSCNKPFPNLLEQKLSNDTLGIATQDRKVLMIIVDGGRGLAVQDAAIPNLNQMAKHAIYTWNGLGDYENGGKQFNNINGWANMLTGVTQSKHKIDSTFDDNDLTDYPTFITRLKEVKPSWKTVAFCSSDSLQKELLSNTTESKSFNGDDDAVSGATVSELSSEDSTRVIIAEFRGADKAGEQYGYGDSIQEYRAAIAKIDGYVGSIMAALKGRRNYSNEHWLVVVASNKGGEAVTGSGDLTAYGDTRRNTFIMFYNPKFESFYAAKPQNTSGAGPYIDTAVHLYGLPNNSGDGVNVIVPSAINQDAFNIGTGDLTVECKVKLDVGALGHSNLPFLTKDVWRVGASPGWSLWYNGGKVNVFVADGTENVQLSGGNINDGKWHTVGFKVMHEGSRAYITLYTDGKVTNTGNKIMANIESASPLKIGYNDNAFTGNTLAMQITDVRIWKAGINDDIVGQYACYPGLPPASDPNINDLIGFWSLTKAYSNKDTIFDLSGNNRYALINAPGNAPVTWNHFNEISDNICPAPSSAYYQFVPNSVDIPFEIFQWFGINVPTSWGWTGHGWVTGYTDVANPVL